MGHMNYAISITVFIVMLTMVITGGGFSQYIDQGTLDKYNVTENDLKVSPDIPTAKTLDYGLLDYDNSSNIEYVVFGENATDPHFSEFNDALRTANRSAGEGQVRYSLPQNADAVDITVSPPECLILPGTCSDSATAYFEDGNQSVSFDFSRETTFQTDDINNNVITIELNDNNLNERAYLYKIEVIEGERVGTIESIGKWFESAGNAMVTWLQIIVGLPGPLAWLGLSFGLVALLIVVEWLTW